MASGPSGQGGPLLVGVRPPQEGSTRSPAGAAVADWEPQRFRLEQRAGGGSFGEIYLGTEVETGQRVAIKFEYATVRRPQLSHEAKVLKALQGGTGIPRLLWFGTVSEQVRWRGRTASVLRAAPGARRSMAVSAFTCRHGRLRAVAPIGGARATAQRPTRRAGGRSRSGAVTVGAGAHAVARTRGTAGGACHGAAWSEFGGPSEPLLAAADAEDGADGR